MDPNSLNSLPSKASSFSIFKYKFHIAALIVIVLALFYWNHARHKLLDRFDDLVKIAAQQNLIVNYDHITTHGWPWNISLEIHNLNLKQQSLMGWQASVPGRLFIKYNLLTHTKIQFQTEDTTIVNFDLPLLPEIKIAQLQGNLSLKNISADHHIELTHVDFVDAQQTILHAEKLSLQSDKIPAEPNSDTFIDGFKIEANNLDGQIAFDQIQQIVAKFAVKGEIARGNAAQMIEQWSKSGGAIEIPELLIVADNLNLISAGTLSVDNNLQPLATLTAKVSGVEKTIDDLTARQKITSTMAKIYKMGWAVALMATQSQGSKSSEQEHADQAKILKLSVTIQDGNVSMGGINLYKIPAINWNNIRAKGINVDQPK